jgi:hypothetical protein
MDTPAAPDPNLNARVAVLDPQTLAGALRRACS